MADELRIILQLLFRRRGRALDLVRSFEIDVDGTQIIADERTIATTETIVALPFRVSGYCWVRNLDDTHSVSIRPSAGADSLITLGPRKFAIFRPEGTRGGLFMIATDAAVQVELVLVPGTLGTFLEEETSIEDDPVYIFEEDGVTPIAME